MISDILEKLLFRNQPVSEEERAQLLDWFARVEPMAGAANPLTGKVTPGPTPTDIVNMIEEALKSRQWVNKLSDISPQMGLQIAGEFRTGNGKTPGDGFTGGRFGWPGFTYNSTEYFLVGVSNDVLQVGLSLVDGKIVFGGGDGWLDQYGLFFKNQEGFLGFLSLTGSAIDDVGLLINNGDHLVIQNLVGGKSIILTVDDVSHNAKNFTFADTGLDMTAGMTYSIGGVPIASTTAETNAADIFGCASSGASSFSGTIASKSGTDVVYNAGFAGQENCLVATSTSQLAKMRLYNTTRGTSALISQCVTATNTITLTATVPVGWTAGDTITIASQTVSGGTGNWVDLEITSGPTGKTAMFVNLAVVDTTNANVGLRVHPLSAFAASKIGKVLTQVAAVTNDNMALIPITSNVFTASWNPAGAASMTINIREAAYIA